VCYNDYWEDIMKIGIIVYSQTGNTLSVAEKLNEKIKKDVIIERVEIKEKVRKDAFTLKTKPDISKYDVIVFGTFVEAFSLNPVMKEYLKQLSSLQNKKVLLFVTQQLPYPWMGGNHTIKQISKIVNEKQGDIIKTGVINWSNKKREQMITNLVEEFSRVIKLNLKN
jgi:flavodoxin